uniref:valine--tRNA ligase n=1 Tax=Gongylonema pulchrum TaxID=637853 RepID=A0A183EM62_9BILA
LKCLGAVKITPAHDHSDYEVGIRHSLPFITCITDEGNMSEQCSEFSGMKSRSKDVIEPILKSQWYVKCDVMAQRAIDAVDKGELKIIPSFHVATWKKWLENSRYKC